MNAYKVVRSGQALYGVAKALYWKSSKRQISTHLTALKHQNTKTSLYMLSKNNWFVTLFEIFGSVRRKLQSTVSLDHPVVMATSIIISLCADCQCPLQALTCTSQNSVWLALTIACLHLPVDVVLTMPSHSLLVLASVSCEARLLRYSIYCLH